MANEKKPKKEPIDLNALRRKKYSEPVDLSKLREQKNETIGKIGKGIDLQKLRKEKSGAADAHKPSEQQNMGQSYTPAGSPTSEKPGKKTDLSQIKKQKSDQIESRELVEPEIKRYNPQKIIETEKSEQTPKKDYQGILAKKWHDAVQTKTAGGLESKAILEEPIAEQLAEEPQLQKEETIEERIQEAAAKTKIIAEAENVMSVEAEKPNVTPAPKQEYAEISKPAYKEKETTEQESKTIAQEKAIETQTEQEELKSSEYDKLPLLKLRFIKKKKEFLNELMEKLSQNGLRKGDKKFPELMKHLLDQDPAYQQGEQYKLNGLENSLKWR